MTGRLGRFADIHASYTLNRVEYSEEEQASSTGHRANLLISNDHAVERIAWGLGLEQSRVDYEDRDEEDKISRAIADLIYKLDRRWALTASVGYEDYELALREDESGEIWNLGFVLTPSARTRLAAGFGERTYGDDQYLNFSHRTQRTVWTADYRQSFVSARDEVIRPSIYDRYDAFDNLIEDPVSTNPVQEARSGPTLSEDYYLLKDFNARLLWQSIRTSLSLDANFTEREYEASLSIRDSSKLQISAQATRYLKANLSGMLGLKWTDYEEDLSDYEQWSASIGGSYQMGPKTSVRLKLSRLERDGTLAADSYTENRATLGLDRRW